MDSGAKALVVWLIGRQNVEKSAARDTSIETLICDRSVGICISTFKRTLMNMVVRARPRRWCLRKSGLKPTNYPWCWQAGCPREASLALNANRTISPVLQV